MANVQTQPTDTQIQVLMSDWLGNLRMKDEGNYTHVGKEGIRRKSDAPSFSEYLTGSLAGLDRLNLMKVARRAAEETISSVVKENVHVSLGAPDQFVDSYSGRNDGQSIINLATDYFDDNMLSPRQKVDILLGLACHESAHLVHTDFDGWEKAIKKEKPEIAGLKKQIANIIEDERIEYLLTDESAGLASVIGATKEHYFKSVKKQLDKIENNAQKNQQAPVGESAVMDILSCLLKAVRYPSEMNRDDVVKNFDDLDTIRKILTPYPMDFNGVMRATDRITDAIRDRIKKDMEQQQQSGSGQDGTQQGSENADPQSGQSGQQGQQTPQDQKSQGGGSGSDNSQSGKQQGGQGQNNSQNTVSDTDIEKVLQQALASQDVQQLMDALKKDNEKSAGKNQSKELNSTYNQIVVNDDDSEIAKSTCGHEDFYILNPPDRKFEYDYSLKKVIKLVPVMSKALACQSRDIDYALRGEPYGKMNYNKLTSVLSGNKNIFTREGSVRCSSASVCVLIDESGSMCGAKELAAREAAILINETVKQLRNVNYYCYGYTSRKINVYAENRKRNRWALGGTTSDAGTPTGDAMRICAERVRKRTKDPILLLVITDGSADDNQLVINVESELKHKGFNTIGIGVLTNAVERSFSQHVSFRDINELPKRIGDITKKTLSKMLVKTEI